MKKLIQTRTIDMNLSVEQRELPENRGNCLPTVIACLLDKSSPESVFQIQEHFDREDWQELWADWLWEQGLEVFIEREHLKGEELYLVVGPSPRIGNYHVCIYRDGKLFHDPHPSAEGLLGETYIQSIDCFRGGKCFYFTEEGLVPR